MKRAEKEQLVAEYKEIFDKSISGILIDFHGATVEEITSLRKNLNAKNSRMKVMRNGLAKIAMKDTPYENLTEYMTLTRALVYSEEGVVSPAKIVTEQAKSNIKFKVIAGVLVTADKGAVVDVDGVKDLGNLPSREELLVKLLYLMNAPATSFVRLLNEIPSSFVRVLQSIADSKQ